MRLGAIIPLLAVLAIAAAMAVATGRAMDQHVRDVNHAIRCLDSTAPDCDDLRGR